MFPVPLRILVRVTVFVLILLRCHGPAAGGTGAEPAADYRSKATFLYNCCHFIQWPDTAFASPTAPITIGIFGQDPFSRELDELIRRSTIRGRQIRILRTRRIEDVPRCHLLFISKSETPRWASILAAAKGRPIVTVGESDGFLAAGGMVALKSEQTKVRIRINTTMVQAANVTVSSKLLRIATQR